MKLLRIDIQNYKSIGSPISINFTEELPTVLIGKNGSGKSNILEALEHIAATNTNLLGKYRSGTLQYKVFIRLCEDEFAKLFPNEKYTEEKATFSAYSSSKDSLHIDTIESETIVQLLKKELVDIRVVADELRKAAEDYEKELKKIACGGYDPSSLRGFELIDGKGKTTNCNALEVYLSHLIEQIGRIAALYDSRLKRDNTFTFSNYYGGKNFYSVYKELIPFKLKYKKPELAPFEEKFITFNETAIKREITKINKKTADIREQIDKLVAKLKEQSERLFDFCSGSCGAITEFIQNVQHIFGNKCGYLLSENSQVLFKDHRKENEMHFYEPSRIILEAYVKASNKKILLEDSGYKLNASEIEEFESWLNDNRPTFDQGMYERIEVSLNDRNELIIRLEENNGHTVLLDETSAGRRWYFTYYFVKASLSKGDTFIIDEPASMLHPSAQKDMLQELMELSKKGVRVIYSTHSPYLIPQNWSSVGFVNMTNETKVTYPCNKLEKGACLSQVVGDIFDLESIIDDFDKNPQIIAENCYQVVKRKDKGLENAAKELSLSVDSIKSWHRKGAHFRSPMLENIIRVAVYADVPIQELLK